MYITLVRHAIAQGRTFKSMIQSYLPRHEDLNNVYLKLYNTPEGRAVYDETLASVLENFPQYIREMEGIAKGAEVDFYKVCILIELQYFSIAVHNGRLFSFNSFSSFKWMKLCPRPSTAGMQSTNGFHALPFASTNPASSSSDTPRTRCRTS